MCRIWYVDGCACVCVCECGSLLRSALCMCACMCVCRPPHTGSEKRQATCCLLLAAFPRSPSLVASLALFLSFSRCCRYSSASPSLLLRPPLTRLATCFARLCLCLCFCLCLCLRIGRCLRRCPHLCFLFFLPYNTNAEAHKNSLLELLTSLLTNVPAHKWRRQCVHIKLCLYTHITYICTHMSQLVRTHMKCMRRITYDIDIIQILLTALISCWNQRLQ